eukprot:TRINITY_DN65909_c0_g1_i1.p1 TRINITY_DN65909_c0_g1~~TRINITY_DN65909_c0_g1_i1.p1  ORF type:complete len:550 (-),score=91.14 TRINITY_DN65909_c0_g1_i1:56-1705(-)
MQEAAPLLAEIKEDTRPLSLGGRVAEALRQACRSIRVQCSSNCDCWAAVWSLYSAEAPPRAHEIAGALEVAPAPHSWGSAAKAGFASLPAADAVWAGILGHCNYEEAISLSACCWQTARGARDKHGRLLTASASLKGRSPAAAGRLKRLSPHLLVRLSLPCLASGGAGEAVLVALASMRSELSALKEVSIHLAPPRLPRVSGESREERSRAVSGLAGALSSALPCWLDSFEANLRGGCLLAGEGVLAEFASAIPKHLTRLDLDLNQFSAQDARAVAKVLPTSLRELRLLFHGRSFAWLGAGGVEAGGAEELASALPARLEKLHLMMESSCEGAAVLCQAMPDSLQQLALDLQLTSSARTRLPRERFVQALASSLRFGLKVLHLRLTDFSMSLDGLRKFAAALPSSLLDLRLDLSCPDVKDDGALVLARHFPEGLQRLTLCLREWGFSVVGMHALATGMPRQLRKLKLVLSNSPIGGSGARALALSLPTRLTRLNLSLRRCCIGREGERALRPLARRWNSVPHCWVRVCEKTSSVCVGLQRCAEWELWDD